MSETQGQEQEGQDAPINIEGDAVVNNAPDGGGVDNNAAEGNTDETTGGEGNG
jgi:hypothetical protein